MKHLAIVAILALVSVEIQAHHTKKNWKTIAAENRAAVMADLQAGQVVQCSDPGCFNRVTFQIMDSELQTRRQLIAEQQYADLRLDHIVRLARRTQTAAQPAQPAQPRQPAMPVEQVRPVPLVVPKVVAIADIRRPVLPVKRVQTVDTSIQAKAPAVVERADFNGVTAGRYGAFTDVRQPVTAGAKAQRETLSTNAVRGIGEVRTQNGVGTIEQRLAYSGFSNSPWLKPVHANLESAKSLEVALASLSERIGYQFISSGPAFDTRTRTALASPIALSLRELHASDMFNAMSLLAGPGLTIVIDHTTRRVSVDVCPVINRTMKTYTRLKTRAGRTG